VANLGLSLEDLRQAIVATTLKGPKGTVQGRQRTFMLLDRDQAARFGIGPADIDNTLYDAFGQRQVTQYFTQLNSYHVILELLPEPRDSPHALEQLYVKSPLTGPQVPLNVFVRWTSPPATTLAINHQSQFPSGTLSFNLAPGVALGEAIAAI